ncbi:methyl-accepting chemotaxis protein [Pseudoalteromonas sp.]|uniref:methyl-accepting chemotaxis protein n=1 Tax=Pseudoalteromonas sp. TaxID=53249 RepID=UPI003569ACA8
MKLISNLSINKKIHLITGLTVLLLLAILAVSRSTMVDNEKSINEISSVSYEVVKYATANKYLVQKLDELYTQSVTFGDEELIGKADETGELIKKNLDQLSQLSPEDASSRDIKLLQDYSKIAKEIASGMISGTADFSKIQQQAQDKTAKYEELVSHFESFQRKSDERFQALISDTLERSSDAIGVTIGIIAIAIVVSTLLAVFIAQAISQSAKDVASSLEQLANGGGSLSSTLEVRSDDEIGQVSQNFNGFISLLKESVENVVSVVSPLMENSTRLVQGMERAENATNQQSHDAEIVRQSMEEMKLSVGDISNSAASAAEAARSAEKEVEVSAKQIESSVMQSNSLRDEIEAASGTIDQLANNTQNVGQILNVITSIAEQTNLLALNAAIEAARAGEQGRGFAVVADEVRELASRTAKSTNEIRDLLNVLTAAANESVSAMNSAMEKAKLNSDNAEKTGESIRKIAEQILAINGMNAQIATATEEQTSVASIVVDNVSNMHSSFESTLNSLEQVRNVATNLHDLSDKLLDATSRFNL